MLRMVPQSCWWVFSLIHYFHPSLTLQCKFQTIFISLNPSLSMVVILQRSQISPGIPMSPGSFVLYQKIISCKSGKWWVLWEGAGVKFLDFSSPAFIYRISQFVALLKYQRGSEIPFSFGHSNGFQILRRCFVFLKKKKEIFPFCAWIKTVCENQGWNWGFSIIVLKNIWDFILQRWKGCWWAGTVCWPLHSQLLEVLENNLDLQQDHFPDFFIAEFCSWQLSV